MSETPKIKDSEEVEEEEIICNKIEEKLVEAFVIWLGYSCDPVSGKEYLATTNYEEAFKDFMKEALLALDSDIPNFEGENLNTKAEKAYKKFAEVRA